MDVKQGGRWRPIMNGDAKQNYIRTCTLKIFFFFNITIEGRWKKWLLGFGFYFMGGYAMRLEGSFAH